MSSGHGQSQPQLGATFYPGGVDDFYIPELAEVISPAPQRALSEVPEQIQQNLAHLEIDARSSSRLSGLQSPALIFGTQEIPGPSYTDQNSSSLQLDNFGAQSHSHGARGYTENGSEQGPPLQGQGFPTSDQPSFSPFPPIHNRPANVPPSDEEKEAILEIARVPVLNSNDPEMQLTWAQDALGYVEVAMQNEMRISEYQAPRPQTPRIEHQLRLDAVNVVSFLADQHHPKAEFMRGVWLEFGKFGFRVDKKEAYRCYSRAAQNGYARAQYRMGMQFESSNDIIKAIKHYSLGIEAKDSASHYRLGMMTLLGQHGQMQDYGRGIELIKFSAETADENAPQGAYVLGMLQARELSQVTVPEQYLPLNINGARYNIEKAAYLGFAKAQTKMGAAYELCQLGCDFDPALSLHYNNLAARQGEPEADMAISKWFLSGHEGVFRKSEELAFTYAQRAAQAGLPTAEFAMGYFYEIGIYAPANLKEARSWYSKAAEHGNKDAAARIEGITRSKTLSRKDHESIAMAKIQSQRASQKGNRPDRLGSAAGRMSTMSNEVVNMPNLPRPYPDNGNLAPYPTSNGPTPRPPSVNALAYQNPDLRPVSGLGMNPNVRPISVGGMVADGNYGRPIISVMGNQRPYSTIADMGSGRGNGDPTVRIVSSGPGPQSYRPPGAGGPGPSMLMNDLPAIPLAKLDIGFTAPLDPSGADRRKRLQKSDNPDAGVSLPQPSTNYDARPGRISSNPPVIPHAQTFHSGNRTSSPHRASDRPGMTGKPPRNASLPTTPGMNPDYTSTPPPTNLGARPPPSNASSSASGKLPGKGPKTFEEMGVPQGKKDGECILM